MLVKSFLFVQFCSLFTGCFMFFHPKDKPLDYNGKLKSEALPSEARLDLGYLNLKDGTNDFRPSLRVAHTKNFLLDSMKLMEFSGYIEIISNDSNKIRFHIKKLNSLGRLPHRLLLGFIAMRHDMKDKQPTFYSVVFESFLYEGSKVLKVGYSFEGKIQLTNDNVVTVSGSGFMEEGEWYGAYTGPTKRY